MHDVSYTVYAYIRLYGKVVFEPSIVLIWGHSPLCPTFKVHSVVLSTLCGFLTLTAIETLTRCFYTVVTLDMPHSPISPNRCKLKVYNWVQSISRYNEWRGANYDRHERNGLFRADVHINGRKELMDVLRLYDRIFFFFFYNNFSNSCLPVIDCNRS